MKRRLAAILVGDVVGYSAMMEADEEGTAKHLPVWCVEERGIAFHAQERYREAIQHLSALPFQTRRSRLYQIAARVALGEKEEAQKLARAALRLQPDLTTQYVHEQECYRNGAVLEKLMTELILARIPDRR